MVSKKEDLEITVHSRVQAPARQNPYCAFPAFAEWRTAIKVKEGAWVNKWQEELPLNSMWEYC